MALYSFICLTGITIVMATSSRESELKKIIPAETFDKLSAIQKQVSISAMEKQKQTDLILMQLPQDTLNKLPLPKAFQRLPQTSQKQAREIIFSKTMGYDKKNNALEKFVAALPADQAKLMSEESKFGGGCILWRVYCWWD